MDVGKGARVAVRVTHAILAALLLLAASPAPAVQAAAHPAASPAAHATGPASEPGSSLERIERAPGPARVPVDADGRVSSADSSGRVLAKFAPGVSESVKRGLGATWGFEIVQEVPQIGWSVLEPVGITSGHVLERLRATPFVRDAELDPVAHLAVAPDDPGFPMLWGLENTGQTGGTAGVDIGATTAWDVSTGSSETIVAVVDTGIDVTHPDLADNIWVNPGEIPGNGIDDDGNGLIDDVHGWDFYNNDATVFDGSGDAHGTHVAGTIGAVGDNGVGVAGVNWDVSIMSLKFIHNGGGYQSSAAYAVVYAVDHGARAINHSWTSSYFSGMFADALDYARRGDVINVMAAGNAGVDITQNLTWPAAVEATNVVAVAATDHDDEPASFTNYGAELVDIAAPGVAIFSTVPGATYEHYQGTSMAAPHVTGSLALLMSAFPGITAREARERVESTAARVQALDGLVADSRRLDVGAAMGPYAVPPLITGPRAGDELAVGTVSTLTVAPGPGSAPDTLTEAQVGAATDHLPDGSFESGVLDPAWIPAGDAGMVLSQAPDDVRTGVWGLRSAPITHDQSSGIGRSVQVPAGGAWLTFDYWLDSEDWYDWADLYVDGQRRWMVAMDTEWETASVWLEGGQHELVWFYNKDGSVSEGRDAFGLDNVFITTYQWTDIVVPDASTTATFTVPGPTSHNGAVRARGTRGEAASTWTVQRAVWYTLGPVTGFSAVRSGDDARLSWTNPADDAFAGVRVMARASQPPTGPLDGDAVQVYEGPSEEATHAGVFSAPFEGTWYYTAYAYDTDGAFAPGTTTSLAVDTIPPSGTMLLDDGAVYTADLEVSVDSSVTGAAQMRIDPGDGFGQWVPYAATTSTVLPDVQGVAIVTAEYRDLAGNTLSLSDDIIVDTVSLNGTMLLDGGAVYTADLEVSVDSSVTGAAQMRIDPGDGFGQWVPYAATTSTVLPDVQGVAIVTAEYRDLAGNTRSLSDDIIVDTVAPSGTMRIDEGASYTPDQQISIDSDVTGADQMRVDAGAGFGEWTAYAPHVDATLTAESGVATVTAEYRDLAGNTLSLSDDIIVDLGAPHEDRLAGRDRYATAIEISRAAFSDDSVDTVVLATGADYADALGAAALAGAYGGPVLLTRPDALPAWPLALVDELERLGVETVVIVGGTAAVSDAVETALEDAGFGTDRVSGKDRYATAAQMAARTLLVRDSSSRPTDVFVVRGDAYPDALAVSPAAYAARMPVLLVKPGSVPAATAAAVADGGFSHAVVVGGVAAVSNDTAASLGIGFERIEGSNRYETAANFADWAEEGGLSSSAYVAVATGEGFADALGGGAAVGSRGGVLLLTRPSSVPAATSSAISKHAEETRMLWTLGGEAVIEPAVSAQLFALLGGD